MSINGPKFSMLMMIKVTQSEEITDKLKIVIRKAVNDNPRWDAYARGFFEGDTVTVRLY